MVKLGRRHRAVVVETARQQAPTVRQQRRRILLDFGRPAALQTLDGLWGERVMYVASDVTDRLGLCALLVRPDGFVAWASDTTPIPEEVRRAAARWWRASSERR
jgi:hypothetical protein